MLLGICNIAQATLVCRKGRSMIHGNMATVPQEQSAEHGLPRAALADEKRMSRLRVIIKENPREQAASMRGLFENDQQIESCIAQLQSDGVANRELISFLQYELLVQKEIRRIRSLLERLELRQIRHDIRMKTELEYEEIGKDGHRKRRIRSIALDAMERLSVLMGTDDPLAEKIIFFHRRVRNHCAIIGISDQLSYLPPPRADEVTQKAGNRHRSHAAGDGSNG